MDDGATDDDNDHLLVVVPLPLRVVQTVKNIGSMTYLRDMILEIMFGIFSTRMGCINLQCMGRINSIATLNI